MQSFLALILFASFFVGLHAEKLNDYLFDVEADGEIPDRHPIAQCSIDLKDCIRVGNKSIFECLKDYKTCLSVLIPTVPPPILQCNIDLRNCFKEGNKGSIECLKDYKSCISAQMPTVPPFVKKCLAEAKECFGGAQTFEERFSCFKQLRKCRQNGAATTSPPLPTEE